MVFLNGRLVIIKISKQYNCPTSRSRTTRTAVRASFYVLFTLQVTSTRRIAVHTIIDVHFGPVREYDERAWTSSRKLSLKHSDIKNVNVVFSGLRRSTMTTDGRAYLGAKIRTDLAVSLSTEFIGPLSYIDVRYRFP